MGIQLTEALVFHDAPASPVRIVDHVAIGPVTISRSGEGDFVARSSPLGLLQVNGKARSERVLRDGDEVVAPGTACLFRLGFVDSDLHPGLTWSLVQSGIQRGVPRDPEPFFRYLFAEHGVMVPTDRGQVIEDWRARRLEGDYFGFGRTRELVVCDEPAAGLDISRWEVVSPGRAAPFRERWVSIGLRGLTLKWQVTRPRSEPQVAPEHDVMLVGFSRDRERARIVRMLEEYFESKVQLARADRDTLWGMHVVDRIMRMPSASKRRGRGSAVDHSITRA